jgi:DNA-binding MarR family transcriptional regulator
MPRNPARRRQRRYDPLQVLAYIATFQQTYRQRSPSQRRIQIDLKISAPSVVHNILLRLEQRGLLTIIRHGHGFSSDFAITEAGREALRAWRAERGAAPE